MYAEQINLLKVLLDNLPTLQKGEKVCIRDIFYLSPCYGLCSNAMLSQLPENILEDMVKSWNQYDPELSLNYFIGGMHEYNSSLNLYHNSKRIDFAKHAIEYLEKLQGVKMKIVIKKDLSVHYVWSYGLKDDDESKPTDVWVYPDGRMGHQCDMEYESSVKVDDEDIIFFGTKAEADILQNIVKDIPHPSMSPCSYNLSNIIHQEYLKHLYLNNNLKVRVTFFVNKWTLDLDCIEYYVVWTDFVMTQEEWNSHPWSSQYDDVSHVIVNMNHPDYIDDGSEEWNDKFETDMLNIWKKGTKPSYVL